MSALNFQAKRLNGDDAELNDFAGQVVLIVNTASDCGYTPQYKGLEALFQEFKEQGFTVLGFPCNQFGQQEPGDANAIGSFCEKNYGVSFPMFEKINVNGEDAHPLFQYLKAHAPGLLGTEMIKWNFTKFLLQRDGNVYKRYAPQTTPADMREDVITLLAQPK